MQARIMQETTSTAEEVYPVCVVCGWEEGGVGVLQMCVCVWGGGGGHYKTATTTTNPCIRSMLCLPLGCSGRNEVVELVALDPPDRNNSTPSLLRAQQPAGSLAV